METRDFDFAVLDIMGVKGYKLLELANKRNVISLMMTAHALSPKDTVKSYKKGAASYIPKDKMTEIRFVLCDILEAKEKRKSFWWRWQDRFGSYFENRFGSGWVDEGEFWKEIYAAKWDKYFY